MGRTPAHQEGETKAAEKAVMAGEEEKNKEEESIGWIHPSVSHLLDAVVNRYRKEPNYAVEV